jgi:peptidoglycan/LPS O-acetylase OafA/YrhL
MGQPARTFSFAATDAIGRIPCLDGLRGIASLMVMSYHFGPHIARDGSPFFFERAL